MRFAPNVTAPAPNSPLDAVEISLRRLRVMGSVVVAGATVAQRGESASRVAYLAALLIIGVLLSANVASKRMASTDANLRRLVVVQLSLDVLATTTAVVVYAHDPSSMAWVIVGLPVLEGALRYRVLGAFAVWLTIAAALCTRVIIEWQPGSGLEPFLELAQPLSLGLALGVPAGYVAEHLTAEIVYATRENQDTQQRSRMLAVLAVAGQDLAGGSQRQVMATAVEAAKELGYSAVDMGIFDSETGALQRSLGSADAAGAVLGSCAGIGDLMQGPSGTAVGWADQVIGLVAIEGASALVLRAAEPSVSGSWAPRSEAFGVLIANVATSMKMAVRQEQLRAEQDRLQYKATHDHLTGLLNRAGLLTNLEPLLANSADRATPCTVLFLDLDSFKLINDTYGHDAGDMVLKEVGLRLCRHLSEGTLVARMGGDEFVVVLPDCDEQEALKIRAKIDRVIAEPIDVDGRQLRIGSSTGMHHVRDFQTSAAQALRIADADMYERKRASRDSQEVTLDAALLAESPVEFAVSDQ